MTHLRFSPASHQSPNCTMTYYSKLNTFSVQTHECGSQPPVTCRAVVNDSVGIPCDAHWYVGGPMATSSSILTQGAASPETHPWAWAED